MTLTVRYSCTELETVRYQQREALRNKVVGRLGSADDMCLARFASFHRGGKHGLDVSGPLPTAIHQRATSGDAEVGRSRPARRRGRRASITGPVESPVGGTTAAVGLQPSNSVAGFVGGIIKAGLVDTLKDAFSQQHMQRAGPLLSSAGLALEAQHPRNRPRVFPTDTGTCVVRFQYGSKTVLVRPISVSPLCISCIAPPMDIGDDTDGRHHTDYAPVLHVSVSFNGQEFEPALGMGVAGLASGESFYHHRNLLSERASKGGSSGSVLHKSTRSLGQPKESLSRMLGITKLEEIVEGSPSRLDHAPRVQSPAPVGHLPRLESTLSMSLSMELQGDSHHPMFYMQPSIRTLSETSGSVTGGLVVTASGFNLHPVSPQR